MTAGAAFSAGDLLADRAVAAVAQGFRFLLDLTPLNIADARAGFADRGSVPPFEYRPLEDSTDLTSERIHQLPVDEVENSILASFLLARRRELALQVQMLTCRGTDDFLPLSIELYGTVDRRLLGEAERILDDVRPDEPEGPWLDAQQVVRRADAELEHYRARVPDLEASVQIRQGTAGLMVSNGDLLVSPTTRISTHRIDALLQHEVGTHMVTHVNGAHQPLKVLAGGLAGHDMIQEGLAVLAEHLAGGLTGGRLRQLAARVVAVHQMVEGAEFADVHQHLTRREISFDQAFTIVLRVFRSGGLTKDAIYLRGLRELVDHLAEGGDLEPLWLGKMSLADAPLVSQLHHDGLLVDPVLRPRFLADRSAMKRLSAINQVSSLTDLLRSST